MHEPVALQLLISSDALGRRVAQHGAAIDAAKRAGVARIAYTSVLDADRSPLSVADEHRGTEALLTASGVPHTLLRNGWYTENYTPANPAALKHGAVIGAAGDDRSRSRRCSRASTRARRPARCSTMATPCRG